jgi:hypothetical protein
MRLPDGFVFPALEGYVGHPHFWERVMTRRKFIGTTALVGGAAMTAPMWGSIVAEAAGTLPDPRPIPQTFDDSPFHLNLISATTEPSSITDFKGIVGGADLLGTGWGTDMATGKRTFMFTAIDNRFMKGTYVGVDGKQHRATFGFV